MRYTALGRAYWRPFEKQACEKYFDIAFHNEMSDILIWRHNTENVTLDEYNQCCSIEQNYKGKIINPMSSFDYTRDKQACFDTWKENNISVPESFSFNDKDDFYNKLTFESPFLLRLNDRATGECTYLVENRIDIEKNLDKVINDFTNTSNHSTKMMCVQFINTKVKNKNISFRIHVAGNEVVSGYARLSDDWLAISAKFTTDLKEQFIEQNKRVKKLIDKNYNEIVRSVNVLGLHHQGIDVIADPNDRLYFLEVQPFYFSGRPHDTPNPTSPPFWNPYKPQELVDWLVNEKDNLYKEIPYYFDNWLNKENHFDNCYKALSNYVWS